MTTVLETRVLILAPFGRDAQVIAEVVSRLASACPVATPQQLLAAVSEGAAAAVVTEEAFCVAPGDPLDQWLRTQPPWSDFPFVVLTSKRIGRRPLVAATSLQLMGNVVLLERPLSVDSLQSAIEAAVRARSRQYATRSMLAELAVAHDAVEELNKDLEGRIESRTRELSDANNRLMNEIAERERAQTTLLQVQKMEAMGHLTGGIAHDFNNLLHVIGTNLDILARLDCPPQAMRIVEGARRTVRRGARLTEQLLSFARNQSLVPQATNLHAAINGMQELLHTSVGSRVKINVDLSHPHPVAQLDPNQLEMAVLNLSVNARDAMLDGGTITISTSEATLELNHQQVPAVRLSVADSGAGIPPSIIEKVFEPFFTTKAMGRGTGLGLAQVYGFVKQSGGQVHIASTIGQGTDVLLTFPLVSDAQGEELVPTRPSLTTPQQRVLVVEDDDEVRQSIVQSLEVLGHQVTAVSNGLAALSVLREKPPTLLIVDYVMPGMNGAELIRQVQDLWPTLPIILATGYADMDKVGAVLGARFILKKPFHVDALAEAVHFAVV
ncbi:His Kinase A (phospho-acceptor) domain-containing protein [Roseateles sp. YR242]|uniref:response regulator n=1 Tax=Roseateles sp. YR242 TaxID=1855305 RepID=UPI0008CF9555|nr:response regulator [Roseateles sp. YR242]SEL88445.1 His Kinase A (phospho-acceptor) domain-containing protein [Roseateles sp. YR242]